MGQSHGRSTELRHVRTTESLEKEMDTPVFLPGEFHRQRSLSVRGVAKSQTELSDSHSLADH